jgi:hypothetical protein
MTLTYEEFKKIDDTYLFRILMGTGIYTCLLALVTITAFSTNVPASAFSQSCNTFEELYTNSSQDQITLSFTDPSVDGTATTAYLCTEVDTDHAPLWVSGVGIGIFLIYLFYSAEKVKDARLLVKLFEIRGEDKLVKYFKGMESFEMIQLVCVEICGILLLFRSTNATDVIVNSSATLFLGEVDDIVIALFIAHYKSSTKMIRTIEFGGMEIEFDPAEIPEKATKNLLPEGGAEMKADDSDGQKNEA